MKTESQKAMSALGSIGGSQTMKKYGKEHFIAISKKAALARKRNAKARAKLSTVKNLTINA